MQLKHYLHNALKTEAGAENGVNFRIEHATLGFITEAGELVDVVKKKEIYGKSLDIVNIGEEIGDMMWYVAIAADALGCAKDMRNLTPFKEEAGWEAFRRMVKQLVREAVNFDTSTNVMAAGKSTQASGKASAIGDLFKIVRLCMTAAETLQLDWEKLLKANIDKLAKRYPDKFDADKAIERNLEAERDTLEDGIVAVVAVDALDDDDLDQPEEIVPMTDLSQASSNDSHSSDSGSSGGADSFD